MEYVWREDARDPVKLHWLDIGKPLVVQGCLSRTTGEECVWTVRVGECVASFIARDVSDARLRAAREVTRMLAEAVQSLDCTPAVGVAGPSAQVRFREWT